MEKEKIKYEVSEMESKIVTLEKEIEDLNSYIRSAENNKNRKEEEIADLQEQKAQLEEKLKD